MKIVNCENLLTLNFNVKFSSNVIDLRDVEWQFDQNCEFQIFQKVNFPRVPTLECAYTYTGNSVKCKRFNFVSGRVLSITLFTVFFGGDNVYDDFFGSDIIAPANTDKIVRVFDQILFQALTGQLVLSNRIVKYSINSGMQS